ncbi:hypothetical protein [Sutcliffiella sp. NC1]|uniref:hypothetical protein n=1 Tax=Sutcliffiella sp. NC1 TaxID=3004096 RepID=UPI0022DD8DAA|nr:hypothetical protein [Sutcliffiella sp. NC1]WBL14840.1 hypothetical protein O1A01_23720 [Sutcliffiella sp. NC1]
MRRRRQLPAAPIIIFILFILLIFLFARACLPESAKAKRIVDQFYTYEQKGEFGKSWELLHEAMHQRFEKGSYIQDRAHTFIGHFGAETFTYKIDGGKKKTNWKMQKDGEPIGDTYEFTVTKTYRGKYGHFQFVQYVYVLKEEKDWRILWDYN